MTYRTPDKPRGSDPSNDKIRNKEVREQPRALIVRFELEGSNLKGSVVQDTEEPPRRKVVFVAGYRSETASTYRGVLPGDGEVWECAVERDTRPDILHKGALIVRPLRRLEDRDVPKSEMRAFFQRLFPGGVAVGDASSWERSLPKFLGDNELAGARLVFGERRLFAVKDGEVSICHPYYDEGGNMSCGTPFRWSFYDALKYYDQAPPEIQALLDVRKAEIDAKKDEEKKKIQEAHEQLPELEREMQALHERARALGLKGGGITARDGFGGGSWSFYAGGDNPVSGKMTDIVWGIGAIRKDLDKFEQKQQADSAFRTRVKELEPRLASLRFHGEFQKEVSGYENYWISDLNEDHAIPVRGQKTQPVWKFSLTREGLKQLEDLINQKEQEMRNEDEGTRRRREEQAREQERKLREERERNEGAERHVKTLADDLVSWSCWTDAERVQLRKGIDDAATTYRTWQEGLAGAVESRFSISVPFNLSRLRQVKDVTPDGSPLADWRIILKFQAFDDGGGEYSLTGVDRRDADLKLCMRWLPKEEWERMFGEVSAPPIDSKLLPRSENNGEAIRASASRIELRPHTEQKEREPVSHADALQFQRDVGQASFFVDIAVELWRTKNDKGTQKRLSNWRTRADAFAEALTRLDEEDASALRERSEKLVGDARQIAVDAARENRKEFRDDWPTCISEGIGRIASVVSEMGLALTAYQQTQMKDKVARFVIAHSTAPDGDEVFDWIADITK